MEQEDDFNQAMEEKKLPTTLNVLTILTFIGSAIGLISSVYQFFGGAEKGVIKIETALSNPNFNSMPDFVKNMMSPEALELAKAQVANKFPMLLFGLISVVLCVMGAMQMRKLKMQGYYLWLVGEILPVIAVLIFIGTGMFSGLMGYFMIGILLLFILLYTMQRKHLKD